MDTDFDMSHFSHCFQCKHADENKGAEHIQVKNRQYYYIQVCETCDKKTPNAQPLK